MIEGFTGFQIGEKYINEKGIFEVLAIDGEEMVIQWENGERATTPRSMVRPRSCKDRFKS